MNTCVRYWPLRDFTNALSFWQKQYFEISYKCHRKIMVMKFYLSDVAACHLTIKGLYRSFFWLNFMKLSRSVFFLNIFGRMLLSFTVFTRFYERFDTEYYCKKSCKSHLKKTVMGFFFSKVAGCDLTEKRTSSQFLSSECFVNFFRSALL